MSRSDHLAVYVPHLRQGGAEIAMLRLAEGFVRAGRTVDLVVHTLATAELPLPPELSIVELGCRRSLAAPGRLGQFLRRAQPFAMLSALPHTNVVAVTANLLAARRSMCVVSEHAPLSTQIEHQGSLRYRLLPPMLRWAYGRADAVVAVSSGVRDDLLAHYVPDGKEIRIIGNPVLRDHRPNDERAFPVHPWLDDPSLEVVISATRLSAEKDIPTLLRAFAELSRSRTQARLLVLGEGPERRSLEALQAELKLDQRVDFPGRVDDALAWMRRANAYAQSSLYEGLGNALIEALSCNLPVVSTDCPVGPREVLADGRFGRLVPVGDWHAMAGALEQALEERLAPAGARESTDRFSVTAACAAYLNVFDALAAAHRC